MEFDRKDKTFSDPIDYSRELIGSRIRLRAHECRRHRRERSFGG